jgi:hypothetical protein
VHAGRLSIDEQIEAFYQAVRRNPMIPEILARAAQMNLAGWYLTAGCLFQTVWNVVTGRPAAEGIKDYDLFYFDDADVSWEAEDAVITAAAVVFADLPAAVEVRNEARVHLWYEQRFGVACPPFVSSEAAIDCFAATTCCLGIRAEQGRWRLYAPHGAVRRLQPRGATQPGARPPGRVRGQDRPVARAMAVADRPTLARRPPRRQLRRCVATSGLPITARGR